ncbi:MAG TPA: antibiotic biosynthesis monooxygenase [Thermomicrobiales bacterium]|nr:antibiotic biosynthesis monooxygenase [Thermomicrobiales bacterium]
MATRSPVRPASTAPAAPVTVVTQTRAAAGQDAAFAAWQQRVSSVVAGVPGFINQSIIPPDPPAQVDWVILQRFASADDARAWLQSGQRAKLVEEAQPMLVGNDDVHLMEDGDAAATAAPVSAVIATRVKPGQEAAFRAWEARIGAAQSRAPGFQGYRSTPPTPGVQDDWVTILRFDSEPHLNDWLKSPERQRLVDESAGFTDESHVRTVQTGFDQWFRSTGGPPPAAWKQNMLVLLGLYPVVFLFGLCVGTPLLSRGLSLPFWLTLFVGNVVSITLLNWIVPWISRRFGWWLHPDGPDAVRTTLAGAAVVVVLYGLCLFVFSRLS